MNDYLIYIPVDYTGKCVEVESKDVIRVYDDEIPELGVSVNYTDYFINSHYIDVHGSTILDTHAVCLSSDRLTNDYVYRFDFPSILIVVYIFIAIIYFIVSTIVKALFRRVK